MTAMTVRIVLLLSLCFVGIPAHSRSCTQANCTRLETELEAALKDEIPPNLTSGHGSKYFSNAHNISRALYPPRRLPASFILIKVKLYNASSNRINISKYIWTLSCIYGILPRNLLAAVSLGTLYHEREVLEVTVPEFCTDVPGEKYMQYALSSIQDFAVIPKSSDPRLNTAECVFKIEDCEGDCNVNELSYVGRNDRYELAISLFQLLVPFLGGVPIGLFIAFWHGEEIDTKQQNSVQKRNYTKHLKAFKVTVVIMVFLEVCVLCLCIGLAKLSGLKNMPSICCIVVSSVNLGVFSISMVVLIALEKVEKVFYVCFPLLSVAVCYHFFWVLLGLFANPSWAFPILLSICTLVLLFYNLEYYLWTDKYLAAHIALFLYLVIIFLLFLAFTCMSVKFFLANQLISRFIQTLLTLIVGLLFSLISYFKPSLPTSKGKQQGEVELPLVPT